MIKTLTRSQNYAVIPDNLRDRLTVEHQACRGIFGKSSLQRIADLVWLKKYLFKRFPRYPPSNYSSSCHKDPLKCQVYKSSPQRKTAALNVKINTAIII